MQVLPLGASKGNGVAWLLDHLGVDATHVMAMGDGENDVEMLQLAGVSTGRTTHIDHGGVFWLSWTFYKTQNSKL